MILVEGLDIQDDFDPSKLDESMTQEAKDILKMLDDRIFVIEDIINEGIRLGEEKGNPDYYMEFYQDFYKQLLKSELYGFEHKEFREHPVYFKFTNNPEEPLKHLEFRHFVLNLVFWYPIITADPSMLCDEHIVTKPMMRRLNTAFIAAYMNKFYAKPYARKINYRKRSEVFADVNYLFNMIPLKFNDFIGLSISIEEIRDMARRMPEFEKGLYVRIDETKQPAEQEQQKKEFDKKQIGLIEADTELTTLRAMVGARAVKNAQLAEFVSIIGNKPDENGITISTPINNNYLTGNLGSILKYYTNNISGRKAAITNHEFMGPGGYLLILVALLSAQVKLSKTVTDCNTVNPIPLTIKSEEHLKSLDGRRYRFSQLDPYKILDADEDKDLIGKTLWFRSPITCAAPDGVCRECYGELYHTNIDLHSAGCYAAFTEFNPIVQGLLAAKHFQGTSSKMIDFGKEFEKYMLIATTDIILNPQLEDMELYSLIIKIDDIESSDYLNDDDDIEKEQKYGNKGKKKRRKKSEEDELDDDIDEMTDDEAEYRLNHYVPRFYIAKNLHCRKKEMIEVTEFIDPNTKELYMHDDLLMRMTEGSVDLFEGEKYIYLDFEDISFEEFVFMVDVKNNELTTPMKKIQALIHNQNHAGATTYEEMAQMMLDLTIESKIDACSVHGEMIIRQLIRRNINQQKRPDFSCIVMPGDYTMLSVLVALKQNPSFSVSMSASYLKYQLVQLTSTFDKYESSDFDWWYKRHLEIDEDRLFYGEERRK